MRHSSASNRRSASRFVGNSRFVPKTRDVRFRSTCPFSSRISSRYRPTQTGFLPLRKTCPFWYLRRANEFPSLVDAVASGATVHALVARSNAPPSLPTETIWSAVAISLSKPTKRPKQPLCVGWNDPCVTFGTQPSAKSRVAPAHFDVLPTSKINRRAMRNRCAAFNFRPLQR